MNKKDNGPYQISSTDKDSFPCRNYPQPRISTMKKRKKKLFSEIQKNRSMIRRIKALE